MRTYMLHLSSVLLTTRPSEKALCPLKEADVEVYALVDTAKTGER